MLHTVDGILMPSPPFLTGIEKSVASWSFGGDLPVSAGMSCVRMVWYNGFINSLGNVSDSTTEVGPFAGKSMDDCRVHCVGLCTCYIGKVGQL